MSEKKMVSRSVAVAIGIICIVLVASLGGAFAYYVSEHSVPKTEHMQMMEISWNP